MTVEPACTVDSGTIYQQPTSDDHPGGIPTIAEFRDVEHMSASRKLTHLLALHDFRNAEVWRAAVFEGVASFAMTFVGILTTVSTLESSFSHPVVAIAVFQALVLALCILAAAPATGGHVNPCISWTEMLTGHITPVRGTLYIAGQILGSTVAGAAAKTIIGETLAHRYSLGGCYLHSATGGLEPARAFLLETVLAFFVLFISYSVALDPPRLPRTGYVLAPFLIGGAVGLCIFAGGNLVAGYGGAGINPGRCIGPAVVIGGSMWNGHWVFWAGPGAAGVVMAALYWNIPPTHVQVYNLRKAARTKNQNKNVIPFQRALGSTGSRIRRNRDHSDTAGSKTSFEV